MSVSIRKKDDKRIVVVKGFTLPRDGMVSILCVHSDGRCIDEWGNEFKAVEKKNREKEVRDEHIG